VLDHKWQTILVSGVFRSRKPFKFWWAPTISLERLTLQLSNFVGLHKVRYIIKRQHIDDKSPLKDLSSICQCLSCWQLCLYIYLAPFQELIT